MAYIIVHPTSDGDINGIVRKTGEIPRLRSSGLHPGSLNSFSSLFIESTAREVCVDEAPETYFEFSFGRKRLILTNYTVAANSKWARSENFPVAWNVEGKVNGKWQRIGHVDNCNLINIYQRIFKPDFVCRIEAIRLIMVGTSTAGNVLFCLYKMDLFGIYENDPTYRCTNRYRKQSSIAFIGITLLLSI